MNYHVQMPRSSLVRLGLKPCRFINLGLVDYRKGTVPSKPLLGVLEVDLVPTQIPEQITGASYHPP